MTSKVERSFETEIKDISDKIVHYKNQKHLASQKMSIVRQKLEDIDHFFNNYGYENEFNCITQMVANERVCKEVQFDQICLDLEHFNKKLIDLNDKIHILRGKNIIL